MKKIKRSSYSARGKPASSTSLKFDYYSAANTWNMTNLIIPLSLDKERRRQRRHDKPFVHEGCQNSGS